MIRYAVTYVTTLVIFGLIDAVWLGVIAGAMYRNTLGDILLPNFRAAPAIVFYLLNIAGLMIFVVPATPVPGAWRSALLFGALFGVFTYATYDLTNYATLRAWTLKLTLADIAWGAFVTGAAASLGIVASDWILRALGRGP